MMMALIHISGQYYEKPLPCELDTSMTSGIMEVADIVSLVQSGSPVLIVDSLEDAEIFGVDPDDIETAND